MSDHYVGTMKGVILSRCPSARLVDITHGVTPFCLWEGAYSIAQAAPFFPVGTVHVVIVDPGVGTDRKAILAESNGQIFIGPDNGVLSFFLDGAIVYEISNPDLFLSNVSSTFHGRDIFAAVGASVAAGTPLENVGPLLANPVKLEGLAPKNIRSNEWTGRVLSVDHFGNVITNIPAAKVSIVTLQTERGLIDDRRKTFAQAPPGEIFLYAGSSGFVEVGMNQAKAAQALQLRPGDPLVCRMLVD